MAEIAEQKRMEVVCTGAGSHAPRNLGYVLLYIYADGGAQANYYNPDDRSFRATVYIGPERRKAVAPAVCPTCAKGNPKRASARIPQDVLTTSAVTQFRRGESMVDVSRML